VGRREGGGPYFYRILGLRGERERAGEEKRGRIGEESGAEQDPCDGKGWYGQRPSGWPPHVCCDGGCGTLRMAWSCRDVRVKRRRGSFTAYIQYIMLHSFIQYVTAKSVPDSSRDGVRAPLRHRVVAFKVCHTGYRRSYRRSAIGAVGCFYYVYCLPHHRRPTVPPAHHQTLSQLTIAPAQSLGCEQPPVPVPVPCHHSLSVSLLLFWTASDSRSLTTRAGATPAASTSTGGGGGLFGSEWPGHRPSCPCGQ
jgi:hypothetical protein